MIALIIAGGFAKRMWPITKSMPKCLLEIKGKPVLQWQIELLRKYGIKDIVVCTGYLADNIENIFGDGSQLGVRIRYSVESEPLGTAGAIRNAGKYIRNTFIDLNGDLFLDVNLKRFMDFHKNKGGIGSIAVHESDHPKDSDSIAMDKNNRIISLSKGVNLTKSGLHIFEPEIIDFIPDHFCNREEVLKELLKEGKQVYGYLTSEFMKDVGTFERYNYVKGILEK